MHPKHVRYQTAPRADGSLERAYDGCTKALLVGQARNWRSEALAAFVEDQDIVLTDFYRVLALFAAIG